MKVSITIANISSKCNLNISQTLIITKKSFFYTILGFIQSRSVVLSDIEGIIQLIPRSYRNDKPINTTGIGEIYIKCDCVNGSLVNGIRVPSSYIFALDKPLGLKTYKGPRIKFFKKIRKSVWSHITFYLEDDGHKAVDFNGETLSFTCQLVKNYFYIIKWT